MSASGSMNTWRNIKLGLSMACCLVLLLLSVAGLGMLWQRQFRGSHVAFQVAFTFSAAYSLIDVLLLLAITFILPRCTCCSSTISRFVVRLVYHTTTISGCLGGLLLAIVAVGSPYIAIGSIIGDYYSDASNDVEGFGIANALALVLSIGCLCRFLTAIVFILHNDDDDGNKQCCRSGSTKVIGALNLLIVIFSIAGVGLTLNGQSTYRGDDEYLLRSFLFAIILAFLDFVSAIAIGGIWRVSAKAKWLFCWQRFGKYAYYSCFTGGFFYALVLLGRAVEFSDLGPLSPSFGCANGFGCANIMAVIALLGVAFRFVIAVAIALEEPHSVSSRKTTMANRRLEKTDVQQSEITVIISNENEN